jgi:hypothetical protein
MWGRKVVWRVFVTFRPQYDSRSGFLSPPAEPTIKLGYVEVAGKTGWVAGHREIWPELVLAALAIAVLEWLIYLRRVYI